MDVSPTTFHYRPEILAQLLLHGVRPAPGTRPALVQAFLNDLYRYEIRTLKRRLLRREFPQADYFGLVVDLRRKYPLVSVPVHHWTVPGSSAGTDQRPLC